ncbi:MAG: hypothetical protein QMD01_04560 [Thermodesulfovibrionales bacterium]|nr:hypothetical protein [Thermodesulfovibrionales bacterium]
MDHKLNCSCGEKVASLNFKDEVMPTEVITGLYCPACSDNISFDPENMILDNGWIISYDMEIAQFMGYKLPSKEITPEFLFDEGYCTWRGVTPTDYIDSIAEREEMIKLSKTDPKRYIAEIKDWVIRRMERLRASGWRKANGRETIGV